MRTLTLQPSHKWMSDAIGEKTKFGTLIRLAPGDLPVRLERTLMQDSVCVNIVYGTVMAAMSRPTEPVPGVVSYQDANGRITAVNIPVVDFQEKLDEFLQWLNHQKSNSHEVGLRRELVYKILSHCRNELLCPAQ